MMTIPLAPIAGQPARQAKQDADEIDPAVPDRRGHIARHIEVVRAAVRDGVNVHGYFAGSHVDFATQRRTLKSSARWYAHLMRAHRKAGGAP